MTSPPRKPRKVPVSRERHSRLMVQLSYPLANALKAEAAAQGKQWQTLLKDLLVEALGIDEADESPDIVKRRPATDLHQAMHKLKTK